MPNPDDRIEILLVEDAPADAELCIRSLKKHPLTNNLIWTNYGAEALDCLFGKGSFVGRDRNHTPKVVLLDLRLPMVDGLEVLRQIRADARLKTLPVVVMTWSKESQEVAESYRLGANRFVSKPVEFDEFANVAAQLGLYWVLVNRPPPD